MLMFDIPFGTTDWAAVERTEHPGETGKAYWRTKTFNNIRVRMVEYTPGYLADHWCQKGHSLLVLEGELSTGLAAGRPVTPRGTRYSVLPLVARTTSSPSPTTGLCVYTAHLPSLDSDEPLMVRQMS
ncbi:MAG: DHCW motif cupin fold protein [Gemmatimonadaceae bacterium]|nr:DHCW motif cupin fold protein [Gemmatimonadaceae bacterium]